MKRAWCFLLALQAAFFLVGLVSTGIASDETPLPSDVHALVKLLDDPTPKVRADAAKKLGRIDKKDAPAAVPALVRLLDDREVACYAMPFQYTVDGYAMQSLRDIGAPAAPALLKALKDSRTKFRMRVVEALAGIRPPAKETVAAIVEMLGDKDLDVRRQAVDALMGFGPVARPGLPKLLELAQNDPVPVVRTFAVAAVAAVDTEGTEAVPALIRALGDKDAEVRSQATRRLGYYGPRARAAVGPLIAVLADRQWRTQQISADSYGSQTVRSDAAGALGDIGPEAGAAMPALRKMLHTDEDGTTRVAAARAMLRIAPKDPEALSALVAMFEEDPLGTNQDAAPANLCDAAWVLRELGPRAVPAIPALNKALDHEAEFVRACVAEALAAIARKDAVPLLIERMTREKADGDKKRESDDVYCGDTTVREAIARALGELGPEAAAAVPILAATLADEKDDWFVHEAAAEALGKMGPAAAAAVPQLIRALDYEDTDTSCAAAASLGRIGPAARAAVPRLRAMLADEKTPEDVREDVKKALERIEPEAGRNEARAKS